MKKIQFFVLSLVSVFTLSYAQDSMDKASVSIRNTFQAPMTSGNEVDVEVFTAPVTDDVEYDGILFDIDVSDAQIRMVFNVSDRAQMDPTGAIQASTFERYYFSFEGYELLGASVDESAGVVPHVEIIDGELLIEFSEGMEFGIGNDALIKLELNKN